MKTIHLKTILILGLIANTISCNAQQLPLNTSMENIPQNAYVKDLNNELTPYIGTYKSIYQGNEIFLFITKEDHKLTKRMKKVFYRDALVIKYIVKNSSGIILQDTQNMVLDNESFFNIVSIGTRPSSGDIILGYNGTNCGIGWGKIILKKINATQISWEYRPNSSLIDAATCPQGTDKKVYLPVTKDLIFTKQ
ncbi:hypothetical protein [Chryseobacterium flavum]|uniref:hypothetical protein n=1 Tax=Chryseobacterium flavum TaxID=415851 RepID=UPI0028AB9790|nr:hypothetical protein [Chryseobacterium flavum]